jgi:hypothetical protein
MFERYFLHVQKPFGDLFFAIYDMGGRARSIRSASFRDIATCSFSLPRGARRSKTGGTQVGT